MREGASGRRFRSVVRENAPGSKAFEEGAARAPGRRFGEEGDARALGRRFRKILLQAAKNYFRKTPKSVSESRNKKALEEGVTLNK